MLAKWCRNPCTGFPITMVLHFFWSRFFFFFWTDSGFSIHVPAWSCIKGQWNFPHRRKPRGAARSTRQQELNMAERAILQGTGDLEDEWILIWVLLGRGGMAEAGPWETGSHWGRESELESKKWKMEAGECPGGCSNNPDIRHPHLMATLGMKGTAGKTGLSLTWFNRS